MHALNDSLPHPAAASVRVAYRHAPLDMLLADPSLLAVFGFGDAAPAQHDDPRYLHVALQALGTAPFECWSVAGNVRHGRDDGIAWSADATLQFGALEVADDGDVEAASAQAYQRLQAWLAASGYPHPLRLWNYMDAITEGEGDGERYRRFCVGRARGIGRELAPAELPAATAIGDPRRSGRFQLYWLAARAAGTALENPRQTQAWRYPRQYGPQAPGFARAMLPANESMPLLLSGTAAVVGHASQHGDSLAAQLDETLANLDSLVATARALRPGLAARLGAGSPLKVYVRDADALAQVAALLDQRLPSMVPRLVLHGHVCRRELAVEIDGVHA
ncbi:MAG TPA: pteridine-dependent deoxygenase [Thermomonas sp.]|jgi:chorismate lyase/3-hydroxybenzoate synthase|uniref:chorismate transformation enzyme, FkbO/Hyg5 family n=1 Tax=Thermomonas sp. TaxID=1971895 RepID=UPI0026174B35|nr:pteridine-dependent deoxygenase [Thermomonas sp.]HQX94063.1 pteridine-dependent deoxygenase [Thermomonas sp.]